MLAETYRLQMVRIAECLEDAARALSAATDQLRLMQDTDLGDATEGTLAIADAIRVTRGELSDRASSIRASLAS